MTTPSSSGYDLEPDDNPAAGGPADDNQNQEQNFTLVNNPPVVSATPVVLDLGETDDDAEDYDDDRGGRAALDFDAPARRAGGQGGRAPLDLSSLIGEFEAELQQQRTRREPTPSAVPPEAAALVTAPGDAEEIARLRAELQAERGNLRRAQADMVNARRKAEQERGRAVQDATERVIRQFFPLFDDFERGLATTRESRSYDQLATGVDGILRNVDALLARYGVQPINSLGQLFDPTLHEAVGVVETTEEPEETVMQELRKGYMLGDRLLRAAMVRVARRPASASANADADAAVPDAPTDTAETDAELEE